MARRHRRLWTAGEKRSICHRARARAPGVSVAQVARRYAVNANLIFKWLRDPRFASGDEEAADEGEKIASEPMRFLPVELVSEGRAEKDGLDRSAEAALPATSTGGAIQIELAGGHRLRIEGTCDPDALARLLRGPAG